MPAVNGVGDYSSAVDARRWWASGILHWSVRPPLLLLADPSPIPLRRQGHPYPGDGTTPLCRLIVVGSLSVDGLIFSTSERAEVALADTC